MSYAIRVAAKRRNITRLCHFTPSKNFVRIAKDPWGLLASKHLSIYREAVFNPTDPRRFDGFLNHVCCSVEYPNAWYFKKAKEQCWTRFRDWIVLFINPHYLWAAGTRFCPQNAAANSGGDAHEGIEAFEAMFAPRVAGVDGNTYIRGPKHPAFLPTDEQAEVLILNRVVRKDLLGIVVKNEAQARREVARLKRRNVKPPRILLVPDLFGDPLPLSKKLRSGLRLEARVYHRGG